MSAFPGSAGKRAVSRPAHGRMAGALVCEANEKFAGGVRVRGPRYRGAGRGPGRGCSKSQPGPGYLRGRSRSSARSPLPVSTSAMSLCASRAIMPPNSGVKVDFRQGDAAATPFAPDVFDFIVCRAAFKNFGDPAGAIAEMHRVLRPGGQAVIRDMRRDASDAALDAAVRAMRLGPIAAVLNRFIFRRLRSKAYTRDEFDAHGRRFPVRRRGDPDERHRLRRRAAQAAARAAGVERNAMSLSQAVAKGEGERVGRIGERAIGSPLVGYGIHASQIAARTLPRLCWGWWREAPDGVWAAASAQVGFARTAPRPFHRGGPCFRIRAGPACRAEGEFMSRAAPHTSTPYAARASALAMSSFGWSN